MKFSSFHGPDFDFEVLATDGGSATDQLAAWSRKAAAADRVACVYLTAVWCPANSKLERALTDPRMQRAFSRVHVASFDIDVWGDALTQAGFSIGAVPVFYLLDSDGKPTGVKIHGGAWKEDIPENMAPPLEQFFDRARAAIPVRPAPVAAAAAAPESPPSRGRTIVTAVAAIALLVLAAALKVYWDGQQSREKSDAEQSERIKRDVEKSIHDSLAKQREK